MGLSGLALGLLVAAPQLTGSLLRIPFGAWVKDVGAAKPFLVLLGGAVVGMAGLSTILVTLGTDGLTMAHYPLVFLFGALSGCGIATFSVGAAQTSYWSPEDRQGTMLAVYAGLGNSSPGIFTLLVPVALAVLGLTGAYLAWFGFLVCGTFVYGLIAVDPRSSSSGSRGSRPRQRSNGPKRGARSCSRAGTRWRRSCSGLGSASPTRRCSGSSRHTCRRPSAARRGWSADSARSAASLSRRYSGSSSICRARRLRDGFVVFFVLAIASIGLSGELYRTRVVPTPDGPVPSDD